jgi:hypothetical protein
LRADLAYILKHWSEHCFDIWEEEKGLHYYTLSVSAAALQGRRSLASPARQRRRLAQTAAAQAEAIRQLLDGYWLEDQGYYRSRILESGQRSAKELDIAVIFAALHAGGSGGAHSVDDARMHATLARLEALFDAAYPINRHRPPSHAPAMGRYAGDVYYSGGAYYFSTLAAAEFCFRAAARAGADAAATSELVARGDASCRRCAASRRRTATCRSSSTSNTGPRPPRDNSPGATPRSFPASPPGARCCDDMRARSRTSACCARQAGLWYPRSVLPDDGSARSSGSDRHDRQLEGTSRRQRRCVRCRRRSSMRACFRSWA